MPLNVLEPRNFEGARDSESNDNQAEITTRCGNRDYSARARARGSHASSAFSHGEMTALPDSLSRRPLSRAHTFIRARYFALSSRRRAFNRDRSQDTRYGNSYFS